MSGLPMASFPDSYENFPAVPLRLYKGPTCLPKNACFKASHVTPQTDFLINTYLTRPDSRPACQ